jgi:hypothetical protein
VGRDRWRRALGVEGVGDAGSRGSLTLGVEVSFGIEDGWKLCLPHPIERCTVAQSRGE